VPALRSLAIPNNAKRIRRGRIEYPFDEVKSKGREDAWRCLARKDHWNEIIVIEPSAVGAETY